MLLSAARSIVSGASMVSGSSVTAVTRTVTGWSSPLVIVVANRPLLLDRVTARGASTSIEPSWPEIHACDASASAWAAPRVDAAGVGEGRQRLVRDDARDRVVAGQHVLEGVTDVGQRAPPR